MNYKGDRTTDLQRHFDVFRTELQSEHPPGVHSFVRVVQGYLKLFAGLKPVIKIRGASGERVVFMGDRPVRANN